MEKELSPEYREHLSQLYTSSRYQEALQLIEKEELEHAPIFDLLKLKSSILGALGQYEKSVETADKAITINSNDYAVYYFKGVSLYHDKKYTQAVETFNECLKLKPNLSQAIEKKIFALTYLGRLREAAELYEESDLPELDQAVPLNNMGYLFLNHGDHHRAGTFLYKAKALDPFLSSIYLNLSRVHWGLSDPIRSIKHRATFLLLLLVEKTGIYNVLTKNKKELFGIRLFNGPGKLFKAKKEERETKSILKMLRGPLASALCNDTWSWFGVNISYEAVEQNGFKGDIDILLKRPRMFGTHDAGFTYRGFQVKTVPVDKFGKIKSAKRGNGKLKDIKKQLDLLKKFGCEQIFMLELFILERGYSTYNNFPSVTILEEIKKKAQFLKNTGYGYVVMAEEPSPDTDDEQGGITHMPVNIISTTSNPIGAHFQTLVDGIDKFRDEALNSPDSNPSNMSGREYTGIKVSYCKSCKRLNLLLPQGFTAHVCSFCGKNAYPL